ncbi:MAG TPA: DUF4337 domain-containing protein [Pyrinomonadaceae bacterium]|jgi:hypothetical protein|nr:DUF4337 domain-containing protein [Pyrinomonadaceae bacterium]
MEASDAAEHVVEASEGGGRTEDDKFRARSALIIAFMAMLLAITSLGGGNAAEDIMNNNIQASDTWAFYQAKSIRQTSNKLAAETLEAELLLHQSSLAPEIRQELQKKIDKFKETADRYENEPDKNEPNNPLKGEGRQQLSARAKDFEAQRNRAQQQDPNFDFAEALFQIAIVLASVAILSMSRLILKVSLVAGAVAFILMLNGYFLFFNLPF